MPFSYFPYYFYFQKCIVCFYPQGNNFLSALTHTSGIDVINGCSKNDENADFFLRFEKSAEKGTYHQEF